MENNVKMETALSEYELAQKFIKERSSRGFPTIWHRPEGWFVWDRSHYRSITRHEIEGRVLQFLVQKSRRPVRRSLIRNVADFVGILQQRESDESTIWLDRFSFRSTSELMVVKNGILRIKPKRKPQLLKHNPRLFATNYAAYDYKPDATCPQFLLFLRQLWPDNSPEIQIVQEWFGYCLLADTSLQKILAIVGPPATGKSTIARILTQLLGSSSVASPSIRDLSTQFGLWALLGKKLAIIPDATLPRPCPGVEEVLKSISGEDSVDVQRKSLPPLTGVRLPTRLMIVGNEMPTFADRSGALARRLIVLNTHRSFVGGEDPKLTAKLTVELPGILNWAIEGLQRLRARGRFDEVGNNSVAGQSTDYLPHDLPDAAQIRRVIIQFENGRLSRRKKRRRRRYEMK